MLTKLINLANHLDQKGLIKESDMLDMIISKASNQTERVQIADFEEPLEIKGVVEKTINESRKEFADAVSPILERIKERFANMEMVGRKGSFEDAYLESYREILNIDVKQALESDDVKFFNEINKEIEKICKNLENVNRSFITYDGSGKLELTTIYEKLQSAKGEIGISPDGREFVVE